MVSQFKCQYYDAHIQENAKYRLHQRPINSSFIDESIQTLETVDDQETTFTTHKSSEQLEMEAFEQEQATLQSWNTLESKLQLVERFKELDKRDQELNIEIKKTRFTVDGRKCALVSVIDKTIYEGCNITPTPDGQQNQEEWCYVDESDYNGDQKWAFCDAEFNCDQLRWKVFELQSAEIPEIQKILQAQAVMRTAGQQMLSTFEKSNTKMQGCTIALNQLAKKTENIRDTEKYLAKLQFTWEMLDKNTRAILGSLQPKKPALKFEILGVGFQMSFLQEQMRHSLRPRKDFQSLKQSPIVEEPIPQNQLNQFKSDFLQTKVKVQMRNKASLQAKIQAQIKTQLQSHLQMKSQMQSQMQVEMKSKMKTKMKTKLKTKMKSKMQTKMKSKMQTKLKSKMKTKLQSKSKMRIRSKNSMKMMVRQKSVLRLRNQLQSLSNINESPLEKAYKKCTLEDFDNKPKPTPKPIVDPSPKVPTPSPNPKDPSPKVPTPNPKDPKPKDPTPNPKDPTPNPNDPTPNPKDPTPNPKDPTPSPNPNDPTPNPNDPTPNPTPNPNDPTPNPTPNPNDPTPGPNDPTPNPNDPTPNPNDPTPNPNDPTPNPQPNPNDPTPGPNDPTPNPNDPTPNPNDPTPNPQPYPIDPNPSPITDPTPFPTCSITPVPLIPDEFLPQRFIEESTETGACPCDKDGKDILDVEDKNISDNCEGLAGYEMPPRGDGLQAQYFNNWQFNGPVHEQVDANIDFDFGAQEPATGINPFDYSIRWSGYIKAPVDGQFTFRLKVSSGARVVINGNAVIIHNFNFDVVDSPPQSIFDLNHDEAGINREEIANSMKPVKLQANEKYPIIVEYFHNVMMQSIAEDKSFIQLMWETDKLPEQVIPGFYLYSVDKPESKRIVPASGQIFEETILESGQPAYKDTDIYILHDVHPFFEGSSFLRTNHRWNRQVFEFEVPSDITFYLAIRKKDAHLVPKNFKSTGKQIMVLKVNQEDMDSDECTIKAFQDILMEVFESSFPKGKVQIDFCPMEVDTQIIPFYKLNGDDEMISCGGDEIELSNFNSDSYRDCLASNSIEGYSCEAGFSGFFEDKPFKTWAVDGDAIGQWIQVNFHNQMQITRILYKNRKEEKSRNREIVFDFGAEHQKMRMSLRNSDMMEEFLVNPPIMASSVKMTIEGVYQSCKNGGSLSIFGMLCTEHKCNEKLCQNGKCGVDAQKPSTIVEQEYYPKEGDTIDLFDEDSQTFQAGVILSIIQVNKNQIDVIAQKINGVGNVRSKWPDPTKMVKCGAKCEDKSHCKQNQQVQMSDIKICFTNKDFCPMGYLPDKGQVIQQIDKQFYGWSKDMTQFARYQEGADNPLLNGNILFPPDAKSMFCQKENPLVPCENAEWQIRVPQGKYDVTITVGDVGVGSTYGLKVNDKIFIESEVLEANQFYTATNHVMVFEESIKLESFCKVGCDFAWTRINTIVIKDANEKERPQIITTGLDIKTHTTNLGCQNSFKGGRCEIDDPTNCVYNQISNVVASLCSGEFILVEVPKSNPCSDQRGLKKCIKTSFKTRDECILSCPGKCKNNECKVKK